MPTPADLPTTGRPVPARTVVQLDPDRFAGDVPAGTRVSADDASVEFRTAAAAVVPPVRVTAVDRTDDRLRLTLTAAIPLRDVPLRLPPRIDTADPGPGLRLFLDGPDLYRALTAAPVRLDLPGGTVGDAVRPAGFDVADAVLPADPREPEAVRLLAEWAVAPEKFWFVDIVGLSPDLFPDAPTADLELWPAGPLPDRPLTVRLGCVPAVNRLVVELPPVPLRPGVTDVRLDADPLADTSWRTVVDVLDARAVRAGRTVTTYAPRLSPLPMPLVARPARVGAYDLRRHGPATWLKIDDRGHATPGRTLLVTAACCRPSLPDGEFAFAPGVTPVVPVRPPVWPDPAVDLRAAAADVTRRPGDLLAAVAAAFGTPPVACRADVLPAALRRDAGVARGTDVRLTVDDTADAYLLARVLDAAVATACPVDAFTRVTAVSPTGETVAACPPRAGKDPLTGTVMTAEVTLAVPTPVPRPAKAKRTRSAEQAAAVAGAFAAVTRPASVTSLAAVLRHLLAVPVRVVPFEPARVPVDPADQLRLAAPGGLSGRTLGRTLGRRRPCWAVRVDLGPLDRRTYDRFAPGTRATRRVRLLLSAATGPGCPAVVRPILSAAEVPAWRLGDGRLGRSLWLGRPPPASPSPVPAASSGVSPAGTRHNATQRDTFGSGVDPSNVTQLTTRVTLT